MTQEEKQLLLQVLSAMLPHGVIVKHFDTTFGSEGNLVAICTLDDITTTIINEEGYEDIAFLTESKPYLRPMSNMTEEEIKEFYDVECIDAKVGYIKPTWHWHYTINGIDWLNAHHFDYHNLIERGLAIAITEENNPYKE